MRTITFALLIGVLAFTSNASRGSVPAVAAAPDSIVLRITSAERGEVRVHGVVIGAFANDSRRFSDVRTPLEVRMAGDHAHAMFHAVGDGQLAGEIFLWRGGRALPRAAGHSGSVLMMYASEGESGFAALP